MLYYYNVTILDVCTSVCIFIFTIQNKILKQCDIFITVIKDTT